MRDRKVGGVVLKKIIDYCTDIESFITRADASYEMYQSDAMFRTAVDMCVLQIGELTTRLSDEFKAQHAEIPWRAIKAMRNVLVHEYEKVNLEDAWKNLARDVPELKTQLEQILAAEARQ